MFEKKGVGMMAIILLYFLFAVVLLCNKIALGCAQPIFFQGIRLTFSGIFLLSYIYLFRKHTLRFDRKHLSLFVQVAVFLIYFNYVLGIISVDDFSSARWAFLLNLSPFLAAFFSYFHFSERLTKKKVIGLIIGIIGFIPLLFATSATDLYSVTFISIPGAQAFGSLLAYTYGWVVMKKLVKEGYSPFMVNGFAMASAGFFTLLSSFFLESWFPSPVFNWGQFIMYVSFIMILGILSYSLYGVLLRSYTATFVSFGGVLYPLFSALLGWLFLNEGITVNFFVSMAIVLVGLYIFYLEELRVH